MPTKHSDDEIMATLAEKIAEIPKSVKYDENGNLIQLNLSGLGLSQLPSEICQLIQLQELELDHNQLSNLPSDISLLTNLQTLLLWGNKLSQLPPEIGQLTNLRLLNLHSNQMNQLPSEIGQLQHLQILYLDGHLLSQIISETSLFTHLLELFLKGKELCEIPIEIKRLSNLEKLHIWDSSLSNISPETWQTTNLKELSITVSLINHIPSEINLLTNLQKLDLSGNQLSQLPLEIEHLSSCKELNLKDNQLHQFFSETKHLTNLRELNLNGNQLSQLPPEIGQLINLRALDLGANQLIQLPVEIGLMNNLSSLVLDGNPDLLTPPPEIVNQGTVGIVAFLKELLVKSTIRYEAKLLLVGEGGTGKSSLLRTLRNEEFDSTLSTTHGIEIGRLMLPYPSRPKTEITLNTWDFGGQQIYHATHQFFLTKRSLYLVVWNARLGAEQGRLDHWLHTIKVLAPDAPILLVATHIDERAPDLNYQLYKEAYPQMIGQLGVSNLTGVGLVELQSVLANQSSQLPLMGLPWPQKWIDVEQALLARPEHHINADTYMKCCELCGVEADIAQGTLGNYLHDLGKILYFRDDYILSNLVVLKPNWVTKAIGRVLIDEATREAKGILSHSELRRIWAIDEEGNSFEPHLYPVFLRLMERFDLSYQIEADIPGDHPTRSLIPQLLPHQPPENLPPWPYVPSQGLARVEMVYRLDFVPTGIMSWFIVRTHRYTTNLHWREGAFLEYEEHQARAELNPMLRELRLVVQGPLPQNFFTILKNTIDLILGRFEGLRIQREVPCICHLRRGVAEPCPRFYRYEDLVSRLELGKDKVECPNPPFVEVSVPELLYGIHTSTDRQVMDDIKDGQRAALRKLDDLQKLDVILARLNQQSELIGRNFTRQWNLEMKKMEAECPNTFLLTHSDGSRFNPKHWASQEFMLYLVCQHPPGPHKVNDGYHLRKAKEWWIEFSPWLNHLIKFIKFGVPMGKAIGAVVDEVDVKQLQSYIDLMEEISKELPEIADLDSMKDVDKQSGQDAVGPALRALHSLLNELDPSQKWGGLRKTPTPDGNILWLCGVHYKEYEVKPLQL
jgi:internalin A